MAMGLISDMKVAKLAAGQVTYFEVGEGAPLLEKLAGERRVIMPVLQSYADQNSLSPAFR